MSTYRCLQPEYVRRFQCDGTACGALCCRHWNVQLDTGALERFEASSEELREKIFSHIKKNEITGTPEIAKENGACPMLRGDMLCSLQKDCGADFLADVCAEYPRLTTQFPDMLERALCMTCPVVQKLVLFDTQPMRFEEVELETHRESYFQQADDGEAIAALHFFELQKGGIHILQERSLSFPERLLKLKSFLVRSEELLAEGRGDAIRDLFSASGARALSHETGVSFSQRFPMVLQLLTYLVDKSEDDDPITRAFVERISSVFFSGTGEAEKLPAEWEALFASYEKEVLGTYSHVLENYFVNEYFSTLYPCAVTGNFLLNARIFLSLYCLLELFLMCLWAEKGCLGEEEFLFAIRWLAVRVKHFVGYLPLLSEFLQEHREEML